MTTMLGVAVANMRAGVRVWVTTVGTTASVVATDVGLVIVVTGGGTYRVVVADSIELSVV